MNPSFLARKDALAKALGTQLYTDDLPLDNFLYATVVPSPVCKGLLKKINFNKDINWGEITTVTYEDLKKIGLEKAHAYDEPILTPDEIEYFGQPLVLLAHENKETLKKAKAGVTFDISQKPYIDKVNNNKSVSEVFSEKSINKGDTKHAFTECTQIFENIFETQAQEHYYMETQIVIAQFDEKTKTLSIVGSMQAPFNIKSSLERVFTKLVKKVVVRPISPGGAFGGREDYTTQLAIYASLLSIKSGKPVKLKMDRQDDMKYSTKRHPSSTKVKLGFKNDALIAMDIDFILDGGAYETISSIVLNRAILHVTSLNVPNINVRGRAVKTNTPPNGAFRGFGAPQMFFATETIINDALNKLKIEKEKFWSTSLLSNTSVSLSGQQVGSGYGLNEINNQLINLCDFNNLTRSIESFNRGSEYIKRGVGVSNVFHGTGYTGKQDVDGSIEISLNVYPSGNIDIISSVIEFGQGSHTVLAQIAANKLNLPASLINVQNLSTEYMPNSGPTVASRTTSLLGKLVEKACEQLQYKIGKINDIGQFKILVKDFMEKNNLKKININQKYTESLDQEFNNETLQGNAYEDYSQASIAALCEIDLRTFNTKVVKIWGVFDAGNIINHEQALGQVYGGLMQGLGYSLFEEMKHTKQGYITNSLSTYILPSTIETPEFEIKFVEDKNHSLSKGLGELPMDGVAPAIANALSQALNVSITKLPMSPEYIEGLIKEGGY